jgi:hypothetical protein
MAQISLKRHENLCLRYPLEKHNLYAHHTTSNLKMSWADNCVNRFAIQKAVNSAAALNPKFDSTKWCRLNPNEEAREFVER